MIEQELNQGAAQIPVRAPTFKYLKIASYNANQTFQNTYLTILKTLNSLNIDILFLQDISCNDRSSVARIMSAASKAGYTFLPKTYAPMDASGYSQGETTWLQSEVIKSGSPPPEGSYVDLDEGRRRTLGILIKNSIPCTVIPSGLPGNCFQHVRIHTQGRRIDIFNVYLTVIRRTTDSHQPTLDLIRHRIEESRAANSSVICGGDWNSTWDPLNGRNPPPSGTIHTADSEIEAWMMDMELSDPAARQEPRIHTFLHPQGYTSHLDFFLVSADESHRASTTEVYQMTKFDHQLIHFNFSCTVPKLPPKKPTKPTRVYQNPPLYTSNKVERTKTNLNAAWKRFHEVMKTLYSKERCNRLSSDMGTMSNADMIRIDQELTAAIQKAAATSLGPLRKPKSKYGTSTDQRKIAKGLAHLRKLLNDINEGKLLFSNDISKARKWIREDFQGVPPKNIILRAISQLKRRLTTVTKTNTRQAWSRTKENMIAASESMETNAYKFFSRKRGSASTTLNFVAAGDSIITDPDEIVKAVQAHESRIHSVADPPEWTEESEAPWIGATKSGPPMPEIEITLEHWLRIRYKLKTKKSPGNDGITNEMLRTLPKRIHRILCAMANECLRRNFMPPAWKSIQGVMLFKKGDPSILDNFRCISLARGFLKMMDRAITDISTDWVERYSLLDLAQFGFRRGLSVQQAAILVDQVIDHARREGRPIVAVMLDIHKAFPSVCWKRLLETLERANLRPLANYARMLYSDIQMRVSTAHGLTELIDFTAGVLEGTCSSPLFFALYLDPMLQMIRSNANPYMIGTFPVNSVVFADDSNLFAPSVADAEAALEQVAIYGRYHNYKIAVSKTTTAALNLEEEDNFAVTVNSELLPQNQRDPTGTERTAIPTISKNAVWRLLGFFRSMDDRTDPHQSVLEQRIEHVLYNLIRIPCSEVFATKIVESMIISQLTFAIGVVHLTSQFITKIEKRIDMILHMKYRARARFKWKLTKCYETYGLRSLRETMDAALLRKITQEAGAHPAVLGALEANMLALTTTRPPSTGVCHWTLIHKVPREGTLIDSVTRMLHRNNIRISFLQGPLSSHFNIITIWRFEPHGGGNSVVPSGDDCPHKRGLIAMPHHSYKTMSNNHSPDLPLTIEPIRAINHMTGQDSGRILNEQGAKQLQVIPKHARLYTEWLQTWVDHQNRPLAHLVPNYEERPDDGYGQTNLDDLETAIKVAIVPSTKAEVGRRGPQKAGAVAWSFDTELCIQVKPQGNQTCHHAVAIALLRVLQHFDPRQKLDISMPLDVHKADKAENPRWLMRHLFKIVHTRLDNKLNTVEDVDTTIRPSNDLADFDPRFTEQFINTDPDRWKHLYKIGDTVRIAAAEARDENEPERLVIPPNVPGLLVHDPDMTKILEGSGTDIINDISDRAAMSFLLNYPPTAKYFIKAHPATWEHVREHRSRTVIWRLRMNQVPTGENLQAWGLATPLGYNCTCDHATLETTFHMIVECPLYEHLRVRRRHSRMSSLKHALGFVDENRFPPDGFLKARRAEAATAINAAINIWHARCATREEAEAALKENAEENSNTDDEDRNERPLPEDEDDDMQEDDEQDAEEVNDSSQ